MRLQDLMKEEQKLSEATGGAKVVAPMVKAVKAASDSMTKVMGEIKKLNNVKKELSHYDDVGDLMKDFDKMSVKLVNINSDLKDSLKAINNKLVGRV